MAVTNPSVLLVVLKGQMELAIDVDGMTLVQGSTNGSWSKVNKFCS